MCSKRGYSLECVEQSNTIFDTFRVINYTRHIHLCGDKHSFEISMKIIERIINSK